MRPIPSETSPAPAELWRIDDVVGRSPALDGLDDQTLLTLMLARSLHGDASSRIAEALFERFGSLGDVLVANVPELGRIAGLNATTITDLKLLRQLSIRLARSDACRRPVLSSFTALTAYVRTVLAHLPREQFRVLYLDRRNILLRDEWVADGTVDHAPVYNSGPGRVARLGRVPDIAETRAYVVTVIDCYLALTAGRGVTNSRQCRAEAGLP